jgi:two-component system response regulator HydG
VDEETQKPVAPSERPRLLLLDDEPEVLRALRRLLDPEKHDIHTFGDSAEALAAVEGTDFDLAIVDLVLPGVDGIEVCGRIKAQRPETEVIVMSGHGSIEVAVSAMRAGAYDFLSKPFPHPDVVRRIVNRALEKKGLGDRTRDLERQVGLFDRFERIVGRSGKMRDVFEVIESVAQTEATVLVTGESGTGKELVARAIHERSGRRGRPFVGVNCSALTESLLESELFGHVRGAFTGAVGARRGIFEEAAGGTVFLDEIGDTTPGLQVRLLRVLQESEVRPVGASENRKVDARILCATNADLAARVRDGRFREDLYYRIDVIRLRLPPLRERADDIPLLAAHFLKKHAARSGKRVEHLSPEALETLAVHPWPGNVRELENVVERAVVLARGDTIQPQDLGIARAPAAAPAGSAPAKKRFDAPFADAKKDAVEAFERAYVEDVLRRADNNVARAARLAGLDRNNFRRLLARLGIEPKRLPEEDESV